MKRAILFAFLATSACAKKDGDVICRRTLLSHPHTFSDGVERKSDVFECAERETHVQCTYIEASDGEGPVETDCAGAVLLSR